MTKLYHFCPGILLKSIKKYGLTKGKLPAIKENKFGLIGGFQWLTANKDFNQEWDKKNSLPYSRCEYRITVKVKNDDERLIKWVPFCFSEKAIKLIGEGVTDVLNSRGDPENWFIYHGQIPSKKFREIIKYES